MKPTSQAANLLAVVCCLRGFGISDRGKDMATVTALPALVITERRFFARRRYRLAEFVHDAQANLAIVIWG